MSTLLAVIVPRGGLAEPCCRDWDISSALGPKLASIACSVDRFGPAATQHKLTPGGNNDTLLATWWHHCSMPSLDKAAVTPRWHHSTVFVAPFVPLLLTISKIWIFYKCSTILSKQSSVDLFKEV